MKDKLSPETRTMTAETRKPETQQVGIPQLFTIEDVAKRLALPVTWLREACRSRCADPIPAIRLGRYVRIDMADPALMAWINRRRVQGKTS
jgi:hypothetical protein